ncbi:spore germination protein [Paenibacillus sp. sptzw28]|nr:spore germination protein [Paenibacillus sp. sptzw28]
MVHCGTAAFTLPSFYISITTFHQQMLPTKLILSFASAHELVPFPALIEALIMEVTFEALREAGVRLPKQVGAAVSIVGAIVIGEAAVMAGLISAPLAKETVARVQRDQYGRSWLCGCFL